MSMDFPNAPTVGQTYVNSVTGISYIWDGTAWVAQGGSGGGSGGSGSAPVTSVNGEIGDVVLDAADVSAAALDHTHAEYAPALHSHSIDQVDALQAALDAKADDVHSHAIADVTGLQTALDGKADDTHSHAIADVTGLQTALDGKAETSHLHDDRYALIAHNHDALYAPKTQNIVSTADPDNAQGVEGSIWFKVA
jgi:hypothetical protein